MTPAEPEGQRAYSERLGALHDRQFHAALARLGLGDFVRAEPIRGGLFGQNVFVTSTRGAWVLRGAPHYDWQLPAEQYWCEHLHARTRVPVPWPYLIDPRDDIFGWSYAIMPRMPGLQMSDPEVARGLSTDDRLGIARALAENLALMQEVTWPFVGGFDLAAGGIVPQRVSWAEWVVSDLHRWLDLALGHSDGSTDSDVRWVEECLQAALPALAEPFQPTFVMHDYKEQNAAFERTGDGWRVSGLFDLMEAFVGDGEVDLSRPLAQYVQEDSELARAFVGRYRELRPTRPGFRERFSVYLLWDRLVIWEYLQRPEQVASRGRGPTLREWLEPILEASQSALDP